MFSNDNKKHNYLIAFVSGTITGIAWWIIIDILVRSNEQLFARVYILPGILITLMLIILHFIPDTAIQDENGISSSNSTRCARFTLFLVFLIIFSGVIASIWIFIVNYTNTNEINKKPEHIQWFGVGNIIFTVLLAIAALLSRFGRKQNDSIMI
jgi:hypothetical protein